MKTTPVEEVLDDRSCITDIYWILIFTLIGFFMRVWGDILYKFIFQMFGKIDLIYLGLILLVIMFCLVHWFDVNMERNKNTLF